jgi:hypothetical protein
MNKNFRTAVLVSAALFFSITNGCDAFESFPINIPFTIEFTAEGSSSPIIDAGGGCLDTGSDTYQDYKNKINSLTFVEAAYRTISVKANNQNTTSLNCDITVTISIPGGAQLFSYTLSDVNPSSYISTPFVLQLTEDQLTAIRNYLALFETTNMCFDASYTLSNITGGTPPYEVKGAVDFVLEAETEL